MDYEAIEKKALARDRVRKTLVGLLLVLGSDWAAKRLGEDGLL